MGAQLTLFQPGGADYAHHIIDSTPGFENLTTALVRLRIALMQKISVQSLFAIQVQICNLLTEIENFYVLSFLLYDHTTAHTNKKKVDGCDIQQATSKCSRIFH